MAVQSQDSLFAFPSSDSGSLRLSADTTAQGPVVEAGDTPALNYKLKGGCSSSMASSEIYKHFQPTPSVTSILLSFKLECNLLIGKEAGEVQRNPKNSYRPLSFSFVCFSQIRFRP
jgi:hypothetical protein